MTNTTNGERQDVYAGVLGRGGPAEWRLSFQHFLTTQQQGFSIHPNIETLLSQRKDTDTDIKIVDLATGNGIWALEVAEQYPHAQILGTDISDQQFPSQTTRLPNTNFEVRNVFDEVPAEYRGAFDLVHLRLTIAWIIDQDKDLLVRNVLSMLKPGGFVQWSEVSDPPIWIYEPNGEVYAGTPRSWVRALDLSGMAPPIQWLAHLPETLRQHGMGGIEAHQAKPTGSVLLAQKNLLEWVLQEIFESLIKAGVPGAEEQRDLAVKELEEDFAQGKHYAYHWQTVIAQKPT